VERPVWRTAGTWDRAAQNLCKSTIDCLLPGNWAPPSGSLARAQALCSGAIGKKRLWLRFVETAIYLFKYNFQKTDLKAFALRRFEDDAGERSRLNATRFNLKESASPSSQRPSAF
jgi:hypothetical protein